MVFVQCNIVTTNFPGCWRKREASYIGEGALKSPRFRPNPSITQNILSLCRSIKYRQQTNQKCSLNDSMREEIVHSICPLQIARCSSTCWGRESNFEVPSNSLTSNFLSGECSQTCSSLLCSSQFLIFIRSCWNRGMFVRMVFYSFFCKSVSFCFEI